MNTPAHVVFSLALLGRQNAVTHPVAITVGALIPDLAMMVFYAVERLAGTPEDVIWSTRYFDPRWQNVFDAANSIPLILVGMVLCIAWKKRAALFLFAGMLVHCILDLLVHHDDGHRHFFPFSDWRFVSPVSYWDPAHYGHIVAWLEVFLVLAMGFWLWRFQATAGNLSVEGAGRSRLRLILIVSGVIYALFFWFVVTTWVD